MPVTNDQFAACAQDGEVTSQVLAVLQGCKRLARLDMDDPKEIGSTIRMAIIDGLGHLERLVGTAEELARLRTEGPAAELQASMSEAAAMGVGVVLHLLEALTAATDSLASSQRVLLCKRHSTPTKPLTASSSSGSSNGPRPTSIPPLPCPRQVWPLYR